MPASWGAAVRQPWVGQAPAGCRSGVETGGLRPEHDPASTKTSTRRAILVAIDATPRRRQPANADSAASIEG
jgi:hypothetical protein